MTNQDSGSADAGDEGRAAAVQDASQNQADDARQPDEAADGVAGTLRAVGLDTDRMSDVARAEIDRMSDNLLDEIIERPLRTLGIVAGIGFMLGWMAAR